MNKHEQVIRWMKSAEEMFVGFAKDLREENPRKSMSSFMFSEKLKDAAEVLRRQEPVEMEIEGDARSTWWYVCPQCNGAVDNADHFCRHCGQAIK